MRSSRCPHHPLFDAKMVRARCTAASYAFSPTPGLETRTPKAVTFTPESDTLRWAHETWETRRPEERSKGKPQSLAGRTDPRSLRLAVPPRLLLRTPPVASDACETGWRPVRVLVHVRIARRGLRSNRSPAKDHAIPKTEGPFTVGIGHRKGSLPGCSTGPLRHATGIPVLQRRATTPLLPEVSARG